MIALMLIAVREGQLPCRLVDRDRAGLIVWLIGALACIVAFVSSPAQA